VFSRTRREKKKRVFHFFFIRSLKIFQKPAILKELIFVALIAQKSLEVPENEHGNVQDSIWYYSYW
jgi:hypothetical protein